MMNRALLGLAIVCFAFMGGTCAAIPEQLSPLIEKTCFDCHDQESAKGGLDLTSLPFDLNDRAIRTRWVRIHDRIEQGEMPPKAENMVPAERAVVLKILSTAIGAVDRDEVAANGRGSMRRLNRSEYEQNLRDILQLPNLDIRDMLPEDREGHHFNKTTDMLDFSRVQLTAYLEAVDAALRESLASGISPPAVTKYRGLATQMFQEAETFGNREAMFYAKDSKLILIDGNKLKEIRKSGQHDSAIELALFRSAHWPYYGYPDGFVAKSSGEYRVRFSARAVLQLKEFQLKSAAAPVPMTFRARKPSGPDVSGDVRGTGGILDIDPSVGTYETAVRLRSGETLEYSLLGLPVPLALNVNNGEPTYRYPPFPEGGQPGVAFQWIEIEGPISSVQWPPASHRIVFDDLPIRMPQSAGNLPVEVISQHPIQDAKRLLRRFVKHAAREPMSEEVVEKFERLVIDRLEKKESFAAALLAGYKAFLCSGHFLYLKEPRREEDHFAIASRLSHFLTNSRPDTALAELAEKRKLREPEILDREVDRLIADRGFERFVKNFTDYWLSLRLVRRDEPDIRLYPEYRFDDYLVESMELETRATFTAMIRENLPARVLIDADFVYANDRLARHYKLAPLSGSTIRKVELPKNSPWGGLLTQAAILKVTSNGTSTSPVVRGAWVMERLIGLPPPPPPPSVPAVEPDIRGAKSIRELLALHTKTKSCAACHATFDPVGLALENFDILGGWRTRYRGLEQGERIAGIDRAGHDFAYTLADTVDASGRLMNGSSFKDIRELKAILVANSRQLARNLLHQFTIYATGTPVRFSDRAEIESMLDGCAAKEYRVRDLIHAFVRSKIFLGQAGGP